MGGVTLIVGVAVQKMPDRSDETKMDHRGSIASSPVTSLLSSLNRRTKPPVRGKKRKVSSRTSNGEETNNGIHVHSQYDDSSISTTNWVEVVFLQTGQVNPDCFTVQGGRRDSVGVTIVPEWRPPSPNIATIDNASTPPSGCLVEAGSSPKRLLPPSFIKTAFFDSQDEEDSIESSDESIISVPEVVEKKNNVCNSNKEQSHEKSVLSVLLTAQSPLATANIKTLLSSEKLYSLPLLVRTKILQLLPQCDRESILLNEHKATESALNNEYVNAALREWQDHIALGAMYSDRINPPKNDHTPSWKDNAFEEDWKQRNGLSLMDGLESRHFSTNGLTESQQCIYDGLFDVNQKLPTATPIPHTTPTPSLLVKSSLPVHLPRQHYNVLHHTRKQIMDEHSYFKPYPSSQTRLSLALKTRCMCLNTPLKMCTLCHKFYHGSCSKGNTICQYCIRRKALDNL